MKKDNVRYCDRCGVELTKRNNVCGFELCDKCNEVLGQQLAIKNDLSVPEVTALAEWTAKLTKASEDAYNKGYADGMKEQESRKGHWINTANPRMSDNIVCSECGYDSIADFKFCPCCGADMREVEE